MSNKLEKLEKILGKETVSELHADSASKEALHNRIVSAESSMKTAKEELENNLKYQELKESLKALSEGMKEVNKRQRAIIQYSLHLLDSEGK